MDELIAKAEAYEAQKFEDRRVELASKFLGYKKNAEKDLAKLLEVKNLDELNEAFGRGF